MIKKSSYSVSSRRLSRFFITIVSAFLPFLGYCQIAVPKWVDDIGGSGQSIPAQVKTDKQNNIYITGIFQGTVDFDPTAGVYNLTSNGGSFDTYVAKYNATGGLIWAVAIGGSGLDQVNDLALDRNGNVTVIGQYDSSVMDADPGPGAFNLNNNGGNDAFIVRLDSNGKFTWAKSVGGGATDYGDRVSTDSNGNVIAVLKYQATVTVGGQTYTSQGTFNGLIVKYDASGNVLWIINLADPGDCEARAVTVDANDNIIVSGNFSGNDNFNPLGSPYSLNGNGSSMFLAKYTPAGNLTWATSVGGDAVNSNIYLCVNSSNDIFLDGPFSSQLSFNSGKTSVNPTGSQDLFLAKYKSDGTFQWVKDVGGTSASVYNYGIVASQDDNIYISGFFSGSVDFDSSPTSTAFVSDHGYQDLFFAKYDSDGNYKWAFNVGNQSCNQTLGRNLAVDGNNDVLLVGSFCSTVNFDASKCTTYPLTAQSNIRDSFLAKYVQSAPTAASQITAFSVPQQSAPAVIDQTKLQITLTVPTGTNISALVPSITTSSGVTLKPASGTAQNFTSPVSYTLTASCSSLNYTVNVVFTSAVLPPSNPTVCATSGNDGTTNINGSINTYFPAQGNLVLSAGTNSIKLAAVPPKDAYGNSFGTAAIKSGDLLLIIQMQDAAINFSNSTLYGAGNANSGSDGLGGTGFSNLGNSGKFEYVTATDDVPLTGGILTFKGSGASNGAVYTYTNAAPTATLGKRSFQIIRLPQYSNLKLSSNISPPPFNGSAGGIIAFNVAGNMDFNGYTVDVSGRGFRGGYSLIKVTQGVNLNDLYVANSDDNRVSGKGEGVAGTPRYMWDGYNQVDNTVEGLPGGSGGRGAPANAGGGGNDVNAGGGGGGNGGSGGVGGWGYEVDPGTFPNGGRPGSVTYTGAVDNTRLIMGGGGGGGHANDALTGVKGGVGGGIVLISAGSVTGNGTILANGGDGAPGTYGGHPDGSGGGGAGGTVIVKLTNPDPTAMLTIHATGGKGGNTENDPGGSGVQPHGPGGGGGGGIILYAISSGTVITDVSGGKSGKTNSGIGTAHNAADGSAGAADVLTIASLPPYLQGSGSTCYPILVTTMNVTTPGLVKHPGDTVNFIIKITNTASGGNAGGVQAYSSFAAGINFSSATARYTGAASGPAILTNQGSSNIPVLGDFNIPAGDSVIIDLVATLVCPASGTYNSNAEAVYLDPTRLSTDPNRRITAATNAFTGSNTTYQSGPAGPVPGSNYDGNASTAEDVVVSGGLSNNAITSPAVTSFCTSGTPGTIVGSLPAGGNGIFNYQWQSSADNTTFADVTGATAKDYTPTVVTATTYYRRSVTSGACTTPLISNIVTLTVTPMPAMPVPVNPIVNICSGNTASLSVSSPQQGITYNWYDSPTKTNPLFTGTTYVTAQLSASATYYVGAVNGSCGSPLAGVQVNVNSVPSAPAVANSQVSVCQGSTTTLTISNPQPGLTYNWYTAASGGNAVFTGTSFITPAMASNASYYTDAVSSSGCTSATRTAVTVVVNPLPQLTSQGAGICPGSSATISASGNDANVVINWYATATDNNKLFTGNNFTTPNLSANTTYYAEGVDNTTGCISSARSTVQVTMLQQLPAPVVTVASTTSSSVTFQWTAVSGATGYQVSIDNGQTFASPSSGSTGLTHTVAGLQAQQSVTILVLAIGSAPCQLSGSSTAVTALAINQLGNEIFVANVFTPNGDGKNDVVYVHSPNIRSMKFYIYDQWGELLYTSLNQSDGWDGTYKGKKEPVGVYVYYVEATMIDGQTVNKKGTITLLR